MAFKSYSWSIGTTSFRVSQLNYKIERQLQLLKQFWLKNPNVNWKNNNELQAKYYYFMKDNGFLIGEASRPDKDARDLTNDEIFCCLPYMLITPLSKSTSIFILLKKKIYII